MTARNERGNSPAPDESDRALFDENFSEGIRIQESESVSLDGEKARELFVFYDSVKSPFAIIEAAFDRADILSEELGFSLATPRPSKAVFEEDRKAFIEAANKAKEDSKIFMSGPNGPIEYDIREAARELGLRIVRENSEANDDHPDKNENILEKAAEFLFDPLLPPPPEVSVSTLGSVSVGRKGGISVVQAQKKVGKTAFMEGKIAAHLSAGTGDFLGWNSDDDSEGVVLHFDCEQSASDHWQFCNRVIERAGVAPQEGDWRSYCATGWEPEEIIRLIEAEVDLHLERGIKEIVVDGFGDLVHSVNDENECNTMVRWLMSIAKDADTHICGILHLNPAQQGNWAKARGHLGSQLERKAETIIQIERDEESGVSRAYTSASRKAPIPKDAAIRFEFDCDKGGWVSLPSVAEEKEIAKEEAESQERSEMIEILAKIWKAQSREPSEYAEATFKSGELSKFIGRVLGKKQTTAKNTLGKMVRAGFLQKVTEGNSLSPFMLTELAVTEIEAAKPL